MNKPVNLRSHQPDFRDVRILALVIAHRHVYKNDEAIYRHTLSQVASSLIAFEDVVFTANDPQVIEAYREGGMPKALIALNKLL